jgi:hypothetical protein
MVQLQKGNRNSRPVPVAPESEWAGRGGAKFLPNRKLRHNPSRRFQFLLHIE